MNIIFLGAPGSGKGTQAGTLISEFQIAHISTGDMLRAAVAAQTKMGMEAHNYMSSGKLVPDEVVIGIIRDRLNEADCAKGFLLDGFPRTIPQADALGGMLEGLGRELNRIIYLEVDDDELVRRLLGRGRADDNEETIRNRLKVFKDQTSPLIDYYGARGLVLTVKGAGSVEDISAAIRSGL